MRTFSKLWLKYIPLFIFYYTLLQFDAFVFTFLFFDFSNENAKSILSCSRITKSVALVAVETIIIDLSLLMLT